MVNKVILMGHVGKDPEIRHMDNDLKFARFTLATSERWKDKEGNKVDQTEWHNIIMWRGLAEVAEKYVRKGSLLYIEGKIRSRSYDDSNGVKRYMTEIQADVMNMVGPKEGSGYVPPQPPPNFRAQQDSDIASESPSLDSAPPDDLPF